MTVKELITFLEGFDDSLHVLFELDKGLQLLEVQDFLVTQKEDELIFGD